MTPAFLYVTTRTFKNRIVSRVKRLRDPRYLFSSLFGAAYFWFMFLRKMSLPHSLPTRSNDILLDFLSLLVVAVMLGAWALPGDSGGLEFSEAEIQFLFPAPVSRRKLLFYKFLRAQPSLLISALVVSVIGSSRGMFIGAWTMFSVLTIYFMFTTLGRARLRLAGISWFTRLTVVLAAAIGLIALIVAQYRGMRLANFRAVMKVFDAPFHRVPLSIIFYVPRMVAQSTYPKSIPDLILSCVLLIVIGALLLQVTSYLNVSFEEASIRISAVKAKRRAARIARAGGKSAVIPRGQAVFALRERGRPEVAVAWKNLCALIRKGTLRVLMIPFIAQILVTIIVYIKWPDVLGAVSMATLGFVGIFAIIGPTIIRNDLRLDLPKLEILKSYPLSGERLIAAEIAAPLAIISAIEIVTLLIGTAQFELSPMHATFFGGIEFAIVALMFIIPLTAIQLVIQNAAVVLFPAWAVPSREDTRGFAASGQRILTTLAHVIVLGFALIPAALLFVPALLVANHYFGGSPVLVAVGTVPPVAIIVAEVWLGIRFVGAQFENLDVSADLEPAG